MTFQRSLLCGAAIALAISATPALAQSQVAAIDIQAQPMAAALKELARQSGVNLLFSAETVRGLTAPAVQTQATPEAAAHMLLAGTDLSVVRDSTGSLIIQRAAAPQSQGAAGAGAEVEALIVTAQKREEDIQDVPIAISAFTAEALEAQKIEGGFDLLKAIPNVTFSKNNFSSYNFSIRGIGTKAISVTTDPGVAVEFNDTPLIRNRLFEQEYFDVERVEVLRGPQGTLHGRNATAGVINVVSKKPDLDAFSGSIRGEVGNYDSKRLTAFLNMPLIDDRLAVRLAGALTSRAGYDFNSVTANAVNGRDLWSGRLTVGFQPNERLRADLLWERFSEDDNRSRTGKQLCHRDDGPEAIGTILDPQPAARGALSQGCKPGSLYDDAAFGTPNGLSIPFVLYFAGLGGPVPVIGYDRPPYTPDGTQFDPSAQAITPLPAIDPYMGMMQSRDLREISSYKDPVYRAETDIFELNVSWSIAEALSIVSQTAYVSDEVYSFQDYNRFNTGPIFNDTSGLYIGFDPSGQVPGFNLPSPFRSLAPGRYFCDPQLGCSNTVAGFDISQAKSSQFSQELRISSSGLGPVQFSAGANYTRYKTIEDYYVLFNLLTLAALQLNGSAVLDGCSLALEGGQCIYIDPNPADRINGEGHNYYRSKNPYRLTSYAGFGEVYWSPSSDFKVTVGVRYTQDEKVTTPHPTQTLLSTYILNGGTVDRGYPSEEPIRLEWGEWTGRLNVQWMPEFAVADEAMFYASYSRGYKGGGANPPSIGFSREPLFPGGPTLFFTSSYSQEFKPEFVNALELGAKTTWLGGALNINGAAFHYDYKDYQVSKIVDRTAINENFDARIWGAEFESLWVPAQNIQVNAILGYQSTKIGAGAQSIDLMDRTNGNEDYVVVKPWVQLASNCVLPREFVENWMENNRSSNLPDAHNAILICPGNAYGVGLIDPSILPNGGQGFYKNLEGNELPNAPHWTASIGAQYSWDFLGGWRGTVRADGYWQSQSWARVYNSDPYDKLHGWYNANLSIWIENEDDLKIELYAKNLLDKTPITDAFLNSDDTSLTTNVFVLDPRLIGLSIRKGF